MILYLDFKFFYHIWNSSSLKYGIILEQHKGPQYKSFTGLIGEVG